MKRDFDFHSKISKADIYELPVKKFEGKIFVLDSFEKLVKVKDKFKNIEFIGFDTETRPSFKKGKLYNTSLVQIATSDEAFLFRINITGIPDLLINIMENSDIIKVGVALKHDLVSLQKIKAFKPGGFIDLQQYVEQFGIKDKGLRKLAANILGLRLVKGQQTSNWESKTLKQPQLEYAATDAWVCYEIYKKLSRII
ncbi:MAG: 3'-5' exonuclease domain-containing protein 2 [Bacteroidales bacterium]|nr:MAG: 3'-5' exonuclease domain-containing protein 2 [Bacteroidales bacterium]